MSYTKTTWRNNQSPAINADNLNHIEQGIYDAHDGLASANNNMELMDNRLQAEIDDANSDISTLESNLAAETSARTQQDSVLSARMDTFTQLPSGSTSGDAELIDIRVGADGTTYPTAGDAVRGQFSNLKSDLEIITSSKKLSFTKDYSIPVLTEPIDYNNAGYELNWEYCLDACIEGDVYYVKGYGGVGDRLWAFIDSDGNRLTVADASTHESDYIEITAPINADYLIVNSKYTEIKGAVIKGKSTSKAVKDLGDEIYLQLKTKLDADIGKNICNAYDADNVVDNTYTIYNNGRLSNLADWCSIQFPVNGGEQISTNVSGSHIAFFSVYNDITNARIPSVLNGYISGTTGVLSGYTVPASAEYAVISIPISKKSTVQVEYSNTQTPYVPYIKGIDVSKVIGLNYIKTVEYDIYADGTGDYTDLKACLTDITDSGPTKHYIVNIHAGTYDIASLYDDYSVSGLTIPNYVTLKGVGDKHNVILKADLQSQSTSFSLLNMKDVCGLENMTLISKNCRYTVHDDFQTSRDTDCIRNIKDVIFIGENCAYGSVYGSGLKGSAVWNFENCEFDATKASASGGAGNSFSNHNNTNVTTPSFIKFRNCRLFNDSPTYNTLRLLSMTDGSDNGTVTVTLEGCKVNGIYLGENNASQYGAGINYWVNGFGNVNTLGVTINNTDGEDYSGNIDLI